MVSRAEVVGCILIADDIVCVGRNTEPAIINEKRNVIKA